MKILLAAINARYTHTNLALRYMRQYAKKLGYETILHENTINEDSLSILQQWFRMKPSVLCLSVYIWNKEKILALLPDIKKIMPTVRLLLGGPEVSYNSQDWLEQFPQIDHIIKGPGEKAWVTALENRLNGMDKIISIPNYPFSEILFPYEEGEIASLQNQYIYYESSRGCQFRCSYCLSSRSDQKLEFKPLPIVFRELDEITAHNPKIVKFVDRTFNTDAEYTRAIWEYLIKKQLRTTFHFEIHAGLLTNKDFEILATVPKGRFQFEIGVQSTNTQTLTSIHRAMNVSQTLMNINKLRTLKNIHLHADLIVGLPYEDFPSIEKSMADVFTANPHYVQLGFLKVLPGTEMATQEEEYQICYQSTAPYQVFSTKWLSFQDVSEMHRVESVIDTYYNTERFSTVLSALVKLRKNPLQLFIAIAQFMEEEGVESITKNWEKLTKTLVCYIQKEWNSDVDYLMDCVRYDWSAFQQSHYYPEFLQADACNIVKNEFYPLLRKSGDKGVATLNEVKLSVSELHHAIFYTPATQRFRSELALKNQQNLLRVNRTVSFTVVFSADDIKLKSD